MKQLELNLQKRLLIVELPENINMNDPIEILPNKGFDYLVYSRLNGNIISRNKLPEGKWKLMCKGSELTEEIVRSLCQNILIEYNEKCSPEKYYKNYNSRETIFNTALESFISAIEANGFWWSKNPYNKPADKLRLSQFPYERFTYKNQLIRFNNAESRTFNPEKTLIFEIL